MVSFDHQSPFLVSLLWRYYCIIAIANKQYSIIESKKAPLASSIIVVSAIQYLRIAAFTRMGELNTSLTIDNETKPKIEPISLRMWCVAFIVALPSFLFGYILAALNACLVTVYPDKLYFRQ
jgi:uncharacterized membrane protein